MPTLINEDVIFKRVDEKVSDIANEMLKARLDGIMWDINDFRKACCGNHESKWVTTFILYEFQNEIDMRVGGWVHFPNKNGGNSKWLFRAVTAKKWMEKNWYRIDWDAKISK